MRYNFMSMHPERIFQYVREVFTPYKLPKPQPGRHSKTEQAEYQRELARAREIKENFRQRRFTILKGVGIAGGTVIAVAAAPGAVQLARGIASSRTSGGGEFGEEPVEYSGEVQETSQLIKRWRSEVGGDVNKLENYMPRIANLAVAYFSAQMTEMFPARAEQYAGDRFTIALLSPNDYVKEASQCGQPVGPNEPSGSNPQTGRITFSVRRLYQSLQNKSTGVEKAFHGVIHELLHSSPILVRNGEGLFTRAIKDPIVFKKGLKAYFRDPAQASASEECGYKSWWYQAEEGVVDHAASKLSERVSITDTQSQYGPWVTSYENQIVKPFFGGRFQELLGHQQMTDLDGFLAAIGSKMAPDAPYEAQAGLGSNVAVQIFNESSLRN